MTEGRELVVSKADLVLPNQQDFRSGLKAIIEFQNIARAEMVQGHDYGVIPGTDKPSLLKPGAEKIIKLLNLADIYIVQDKVEDWNKPFFHYQVKCQLLIISSGLLVCEGLGECNSMETKYRYRWVFEKELPPGINKKTLVSVKRKNRKTGGEFIMYRLENDEIYSSVNTLLKMAKKRSCVDAALSVGRLSDVFTQDIEDIEPSQLRRQPRHAKTTQNIDTDTGEIFEGEFPEEDAIIPADTNKSQSNNNLGFEVDVLRDMMKSARWNDTTAISWIESQFKFKSGSKDLVEVLQTLPRDQQETFFNFLANKLAGV